MDLTGTGWSPCFASATNTTSSSKIGGFFSHLLFFSFFSRWLSDTVAVVFGLLRSVGLLDGFM